MRSADADRRPDQTKTAGEKEGDRLPEWSTGMWSGALQLAALHSTALAEHHRPSSTHNTPPLPLLSALSSSQLSYRALNSPACHGQVPQIQCRRGHRTLSHRANYMYVTAVTPHAT